MEGCGFNPRSAAKIPHDSQSKTQNINNRSNVVTKSTKTLKDGLHKKKKNLTHQLCKVPDSINDRGRNIRPFLLSKT